MRPNHQTRPKNVMGSRNRTQISCLKGKLVAVNILNLGVLDEIRTHKCQALNPTGILISFTKTKNHKVVLRILVLFGIPIYTQPSK